MANFKRRKCRRQVRCTLCTDDRWLGNSKGRFKHQDEAEMRDRERLKEVKYDE